MTDEAHGDSVAVGPVVGLRWGLKRSFMEYVASSPAGRVLLAAGASAASETELLFEPVGQSITTPADASLSFRGTVTFTAHHGMLMVRIIDPAATFEQNRGQLTVADPYQAAGSDARITLASFEVVEHQIVDGHQIWTADDVRLTFDGCALFNDVYSPGERLDPFKIALPAQAAPDGS